MPKKSHKKNQRSIVFYTLHLPVLLLLFAVLGLGGLLIQVKNNSEKDSIADEVALVLGDDDNSGKDNSDDDDDDDDDDNSGKDNSDDDGDDNDDDNSGKGSSDDDDDDDDDDDNSGKDSSDDDDDDDNSGKGNSDDDADDDNDNSGKSSSDDDDDAKTLTRVANPDGTFTVTEYEEKEDGEIKVEIRTFDSKGNKIMVEKFERDIDGDEKSRVKIYDEVGNKLSDFSLETEDGKELELRIKEGETEFARVRFDVDRGELVVKSKTSDEVDDDNSLRIRLIGDNFVITRNGVDVLSRFPLVVDDETGGILVSTPLGEVSLSAMPDTIMQKAEASDDSPEVESIELALEEELEYKVLGTKAEKLLGVFKVSIPTVLIYDSQSGEFLRTDQPFVTRVLDLFSF